MKLQKEINGKQIEVFDLEALADMTLNKKYKFIQLDLGHQQIMLFGSPKDYHAEIVETYLLEKDIPYKKSTLEDGTKGPEKQGESYKITGAGYATRKENDIELSDKSIGYNISPNPENLNEIKKETSLNIIVEDAALKKIKEKEILETKLNFLHPCLVGVFEEADKYFDELKSLVGDESTKAIQKKYNTLKDIFSEIGEESLYKTKYIQELRELRDVLLDDEL